MTGEQTLFPATAMPDADWWQALWPEPMRVLQAVGLHPGMEAIDLCCGDGLFTAPMCTLLQGRVYAIDLDPEMLRAARQAVADAGAPDCTWIEGDARDMVRMVAHKVDVVLIANTFHGVPEPLEMARDAREVLKPGGRFIVINWHDLPRELTPVLGKPRGPRDALRMSPDDVQQVVGPSGLSFVKVVDLPPYHYGIIFENQQDLKC